MAAVERVLAQVDAEDRPRVLVLNKVDQLDTRERERLRRLYPEAVQVSATTGEGRATLVDVMIGHLGLDVRRWTLEFDDAIALDRHRLSEVYRHGRVLKHERQGRRVSVEAEIPRRLMGSWTAGAKAPAARRPRQHEETRSL